MITGDATHDASLGGIDFATSGSISLTVAGGEGGSVHLSAADALTTGTANLINVAGTTDFATSGSIDITGANNVSNGVGGSTEEALDVQLGAAYSSNPGFVTHGTMNVNTVGGEGDAGEIRLTSDDDFRIGVLDTDDSTSQNVSATVRDPYDRLIVAADSDLDSDIVTLLADNMTINYNISADRVTLSTYATDGSIGIDIGGVDVPGAGSEGGVLGLSSGDLDHIYANVMVIGAETTGPITITASVDPQGTDTMHMITSATVIEEAGGSIVETNVAIEATGEVTLTSELNDFGTIAVDTDSGNVSITDANNLVVGTVDGVVGIDTDSGSVIINAGGTLNVDDTIFATNGAGGSYVDIDTVGLVGLEDGAIQTDGDVDIYVSAGAIDAASGGDGTAEILADGDVTLTAQGVGTDGNAVEINAYLDGGDGNSDLTVYNTDEGVSADDVNINALTDLFDSVDLTIASTSSNADIDLSGGDHIDIDSLDDFTMEIDSVDTTNNGADVSITSLQVDGSVIVKTGTVQTAADGEGAANGDVFIRSELDLTVGDASGNAIISNGGNVTLEAGDEAFIEAGILTNGGSVDIDAAYGAFSTVDGVIDTSSGGEGGGEVTIDVYDIGDMSLAGNIDTSGTGSEGAGGGDVSLYTYDGSITVDGDVTTSGGYGFVGGNAGSLDVHASNILNEGSGDIEINGAVTALGGEGALGGGFGGDVNLYAYAGSIDLNGSIDTSGGSAYYGGSAGEVIIATGGYFSGGGDITVNGAISAQGGSGYAYGYGIGGEGGSVSIYATSGDFTVTGYGSIDASGGNGFYAGGAGGVDIRIASKPGGGYGDIEVNGAVTAQGGYGFYTGGSGAYVNLYTYDGDIDVNAPVDTSGGATNSLNGVHGGDAGSVTMQTGYGAGAEGGYGGGSITVNSSVTALGSDGDGNGGSGGDVDIYSTDGNVTITEYGSINTSGGSAIYNAGDAGSVDIAVAGKDGGGYGDIEVSGAITARGGSAAYEGGSGGDVDLYAYDGDIDVNATIDTSGGDSFFDGGSAGDINIRGGEGGYNSGPVVYGGGNITINAALSAQGGEGYSVGGSGGDVDVDTVSGSIAVTEYGSINTSGGAFGGDAGSISLSAGKYGGYDGGGNDITIDGTLTALGGAYGGDGGEISLDADGTVDVNAAITTNDDFNSTAVDIYGYGDVTIDGPITSSGAYGDVEIDSGEGSVGVTAAITTNGGFVDINAQTGVTTSSGGTITTTTSHDGGEGGTVNIGTVSGGLSLAGDIDTSGAAGSEGQEGGGGGAVNLYAENGDISVTGTITTVGGTGGSPGGAGGDVDIYAYAGSVTVDGDVTTSGGQGSGYGNSGGDAGDIDIAANSYYGSGASGNITLNGSLTAEGGAGAEGASGGRGGDVFVYAYDGDIAVNGGIDTSGGYGLSGGDAGDVDIFAGLSESEYDYVYGGGDISVNSAVTAQGGAGAEGSGEGGGDVYVQSYDGNVTVTEYGSVDTSGGDVGGDAGNITLRAGYYVGYAGGGNDVGVYGSLTALGGALGGAGGQISLQADGTVTTTAAISTNYTESDEAVDIDGYYDVTIGGPITSSGAYGGVDIDSDQGGVSIYAPISTNGGLVEIDALGDIVTGAEGTITTTGEIGVDAGNVDIYSHDGDITLDGAIATNGVSGKYGGASDDGGDVDVNAADGSILIGSTGGIDTSGGDAYTVSYDAGGNAGHVSLIALDSDGSYEEGETSDIAVYGSITAEGGNGGALGGEIAGNGGYVNLWSYGGSLTIDAPITVGDNAYSEDYDAGVYGFAYGEIDIQSGGAITTGSNSNVLMGTLYCGITQRAAITTDGSDVTFYSAFSGYAYETSAIETTANGTITTNGGDVFITRYDYGDSTGDTGITIGGAIDTSAAPGNAGGQVDLHNDLGDITINGTVTTNGGVGTSPGGDGGDVVVTADDGNVTVNAAINTSGGTGYGYSNDGGDAGNIIIEIGEYEGPGSGNIAVNATLTAQGGAGSEGASGGDGGVVVTRTYDGDVDFSGNAAVNASGGSGYNGGDGGGIFVNAGIYQTGSGSATVGSTLTAAGGDGANAGGDGGPIIVYAYEGSITLDGALDSSGGDGSTVGGDGGYIYAGTYRGDDVDVNASIDSTGGSALGGEGSADGGEGGSVLLFSYDGNVTLAENASIKASGGEANGVTNADGGEGGNVRIEARYGSVIQNVGATIDISGGDATGGEGGFIAAGNGGDVEIDGYYGVTLNAAVDTSGGDATGAEGSVVTFGGEGGDARIDSAEGSITQNAGATITASGGDASGGTFANFGGSGGDVDIDGYYGVTLNAAVTTTGGTATGHYEADGGEGGNVDIDAAEGSVALNAGAAIDTSGGVATTYGSDSSAGDGGRVDIYGYNNVTLSATITTSGGAADGADYASAGDGGRVYVEAWAGDVTQYAGAAIDTSGGDATTAGGEGFGGDGGYVEIGGEGLSLNDIITSAGGDATGGEGSFVIAGDGDEIDLEAGYGTLTINAGADLDTSGGNAVTGDYGFAIGGEGGQVDADNYAGTSITLGATIDTSGGDATGGEGAFAGAGRGGNVDVDADDGSITQSAGATITTSGGEAEAGDGGEGYGGDAGSVGLDGFYGVTLNAAVTAQGGYAEAGDYAEGGRGGYVEIDSGEGGFTLSATGSIDTSGGSAYATSFGGEGYGGDGGRVDGEISYDISLSGTITTVGGNATAGDGGEGISGDGGSVSLRSYDGTLTQFAGADIDTSGGNATAGDGGEGYGGDGGGAVLEGEYGVTLNASVDTSGGDATGSEGSFMMFGGDGSYVDVISSYGSVTLTEGSSIDSSGGDAVHGGEGFVAEAGDAGNVFIRGGDAYQYGGDVTIDGDITATGGDAHGGFFTEAGDGGEVYAQGGEGFAFDGEGAEGGDVSVSGNIDTSGGVANYGVYVNAGDGGAVKLYGGEGVQFGGYFGDPTYAEAAVGGDVTITGTIDTSGGYAYDGESDATGGEGGDIRLAGGDAGHYGGEGSMLAYGGSVVLDGATLDASGGGSASGDNVQGGAGGDVSLDGGEGFVVTYYGSDASLVAVGGDVDVTDSSIDTSGGAASLGFEVDGGEGGGIDIQGGEGRTGDYGSGYVYASYAIGGSVTLDGSTLDTSGGGANNANFAYGGDGGSIEIDGGEGLRFSGGKGYELGGAIDVIASDLTTSGGDADGGEGAFAGDAGDVYMAAENYGGTLTIDGDSTVTQQGGYASTSEYEAEAFGGDGGEGFFIGEESVSISGSVDTSGGGAYGDYAYGGDGGSIIVSGKIGGAYGPAVSIDGSLTSLGGDADGVYNSEAGSGGFIMVFGGEGGEDAPAVSIDGTITSGASSFGPPSVFIGSAFDNIELGENADVTASGEYGEIVIQAGKYGGGYDVIMDADATVTASQGNIDVTATGDVVLGQLSVGQTGGGEGNVVFVGAEGSISSADSGAITNIATENYGYVELFAGSGIGSDDEGYENVITLSADGGDGALGLNAQTYTGDINVSVDGDLYVSNYSVRIDSFFAGDDDNINLYASGDIIVGSVENDGSGSITLTAAGGIYSSGGEGAIEGNGVINLTGIGIGDSEDAVNVSGSEGSVLNLTAAGGEGGEINVNATYSAFDSLTITLEDADSDVNVDINFGDYVVMSADGTDVTLDDMDTTNSSIDVTINSEDAGADLVTAQGTANISGDLSLNSAADIVLGDGSGGTVINASGSAISLTADSDGTDGGAIVNPNGGVIDFGYSYGGSLVMSASDGIGADGAAVLVTGAEGSLGLAAATDDGDVVINSTGNIEVIVTEIGDVAGISTGSGDVTLGADNLDIEEEISGGQVTLTTGSAERGISLGDEIYGSLSISEYELSLVSADDLHIGDDANAGGITVTDAVSLTDAGHATVHLVTGDGDITDDGTGSALQVAGLAISTSGGTVELDGYNQVDTLAVSHTGEEGSVTFNDFDALEIGSVDGIDGVTAYDVTLSTGGALTDDGTNLITAETLTVGGASSVGDIDAGLSIDVSYADITANGNIVLSAEGEDGVTIAASVVDAAGGIAIYSASETVTLDGVTTEDGDILVGTDTSITAVQVSAGTDAAGDGDIILVSLGDIEVQDVSAGSDLIAIASDGDITFEDAGGEEAVGGGDSTLTMAAVGDITFNTDFGTEDDPLGQLNVASAANFTITSPFDVYTLDIGLFDVDGDVDFGDTLNILGDGEIVISATNIFGEVFAPDVTSLTVLATGVIGESNELSDNPFVANIGSTLFFNASGGAIEGTFGAGSVTGVGVGGDAVGTFGWLGALDGTTFLINGVTVIFEPLIDVGAITDALTVDTTGPDAEVDLSGPAALQSTTDFVADVFSVDFSLGTNLSVAPAAGGDGEGGGEGADEGGDFLGNFWGSLIETAPAEDEEADDGEGTAGEDLFQDDDEDEDPFGDGEDLASDE